MTVRVAGSKSTKQAVPDLCFCRTRQDNEDLEYTHDGRLCSVLQRWHCRVFIGRGARAIQLNDYIASRTECSLNNSLPTNRLQRRGHAATWGTVSSQLQVQVVCILAI